MRAILVDGVTLRKLASSDEITVGLAIPLGALFGALGSLSRLRLRPLERICC